MIPQPHQKKVCEACLSSNGSQDLKNRPKRTKKRFASLRFCVSSLHRDHANLLCIVKRLFNAWAETQASKNSNFWVYKLGNFDLKTNSVPFIHPCTGNTVGVPCIVSKAHFVRKRQDQQRWLVAYQNRSNPQILFHTHSKPAWCVIFRFR